MSQPTPEQREKYRDRYNWNADDLEETLHALRLLVVHDARDWAASNRDARLYAIVISWDDESYAELTKRFNWDEQTVAVLKKRNKAYTDRAGKMPASMVQP